MTERNYTPYDWDDGRHSEQGLGPTKSPNLYGYVLLPELTLRGPLGRWWTIATEATRSVVCTEGP